MATEIRLRRGTAAQHEAFTGAAGEVTVVTDDSSLRVHDGATPGGHEVSGGGGGVLTPETEAASAYTPVIADASAKLKRLEHADAVALTIPADADAPFEIGSTLTFEQAGAGAITVAGDTGVTVRVSAGQTAVSAGQYSVFQALKIGADEWLLFGALEQSRTGLLLGSRQVFSVAGTDTWNRPAGCVAVRVRLAGAGGGARGAAAANGAAGGGAGGYSEKFITSGLGDTEDVVVGAPGAGGGVNGNGLAGGPSSFGAHLSATGGGGGTNAGGSGGVGSGGDINGRGGSAESRSDSADDYSTPGGDSHFSGGGQAGLSSAGAGQDGMSGSGGGAGRLGAAGGAGGAGLVIVEEFY